MAGRARRSSCPLSTRVALPDFGTLLAHWPRRDIAKFAVMRPGLADAGSVAATSPLELHRGYLKGTAFPWSNQSDICRNSKAETRNSLKPGATDGYLRRHGTPWESIIEPLSRPRPLSTAPFSVREEAASNEGRAKILCLGTAQAVGLLGP